MNYRHAFHAGNHLDVFKHAALVAVLERLLDKPRPLAVLDTHAGIGVYDLGSEEARRTAEAQHGIARIIGADLPASRTYLDIVRAMNTDGLSAYPGSPEIVRRMLRADDRLILCELHPDDAAVLKARYRADPRVAVHHRDGYEAIAALLPPPERRGLVLIDPPFEQKDEAARLVEAIGAGLKRWPTGVFMAWYPIKDRTIGAVLSRAARSGLWPKCLSAEFLPYAAGEAGVPGGGLLIVNTPWCTDQRLKAICTELKRLLGSGDGRWAVDWLTPA